MPVFVASLQKRNAARIKETMNTEIVATILRRGSCS